MRPGAAAALLAAALSLPAASPGRAEGWNIRDLGRFEDRDTCQRRAGEVMEWYKATYAATYTVQLSWTSYAYDLPPGENDAVIICSIDGTGRRAVLVVNGADEASRKVVADRIEGRWKEGT